MPDPHYTAEKALEGHLISQVKFSWFRQEMTGAHPDYLTDDELMDLFHQHVTNRDDYLAGIVAAMNPGTLDIGIGEFIPQVSPEIHAAFYGQLHRGEVEVVASTPWPPGDPLQERIYGTPPDMDRFLRAVKAPDKSTQPPLTKRLTRKAKKAARRARKKFRGR